MVIPTSGNEGGLATEALHQLKPEDANVKAERPFEIGAAVTHGEWGGGEVQRYDGGRVVVLFESVGYRTLDLDLVAEKNLLRTT